MTAPGTSVPMRTRRWYTRPALVLPVVGALLVMVALVTPQARFGRTGDARLTTFSTEPQGARLFYELVQKLGWDVEQQRRFDAPRDSTAILALLDPAVPVRPAEVHAILERVRAGGALLVATSPTSGAQALADSLHASVGLAHRRSLNTTAPAQCPPVKTAERLLNTIWPGDQVLLSSVSWKGPPPASITGFVAVDAYNDAERRHPRTAAVGFPFGRGRIVLAADADLFRNDALRVCRYALDIAAVEMVEYLSQGGATPRRHFVFDEYHQGYGQQLGSLNAIATYLVSEPSGRLFFQLLGAGLVLIAAMAPRALPPRDATVIERRSPLEHVDALGRAYAQVGATRSACARLVQGLRRRVGGGASAGTLTHDEFLERAQRDVPATAPDVAVVRNALHRQVSRSDFMLVGEALARLERSLTRI